MYAGVEATQSHFGERSNPGLLLSDLQATSQRGQKKAGDRIPAAMSLLKTSTVCTYHCVCYCYCLYCSVCVRSLTLWLVRL